MSGIQVEHCNVQEIEKTIIVDKEIIEDIEKKSDSIALSVLNDIVETALDSVLDKECGEKTNYMSVGDIIDQYTPRATRITDLGEGMDSVDSQNPNLTPTEEEIKKFVSELSTSPLKGTGDQLQEKEEIITKKKSCAFSVRKFNIEKKTRLTNLVRTSKSVISKFLSSDSSKPKDNEWEERSEEFVKSIELEKLNTNHEKLKNEKEEIDLKLSKSNELINKIPDEATMENINLNEPKPNGDEILDSENHRDKLDYLEKSKTFPIASSSRTVCPNIDSKDSGKKWNFGSKIVNYIKKKASRRDITKME